MALGASVLLGGTSVRSVADTDSLLRAIGEKNHAVRRELIRFYGSETEKDSLLAWIGKMAAADGENQRAVFGLLEKKGFPFRRTTPFFR